MAMRIGVKRPVRSCPLPSGLGRGFGSLVVGTVVDEDEAPTPETQKEFSERFAFVRSSVRLGSRL